MSCGLSEKSWDKYGACHGSFPEGTYTGEKVTQDGNIITASGMAQSLPFALEV